MSLSSLAISAVCGLMIVAVPAHALLPDISLDTSTQVNTQYDSNNGNNANANASTNARVNSQKNNKNDNDSLIINRSRTNMNSNANAAVSLENIKDRNDLSLYVNSLVKADKDFKGIRSDDKEVIVTYKQYAELFGFIPVRFNAHAQIENDGMVHVRYPWYRFLLSGASKNALEARLQTKAHGVIGDSANESNAQFSAQTQAHLINEFRKDMKEKYEADLKANAKVDSSVNAR